MATCFGAALTLGCLPRFMISGKLTQVCQRLSISNCAFASTSVCLHPEDGMFLMIDPGSSRADKHHQRERWCVYRGQESGCHSCSSVSVGIYHRFDQHSKLYLQVGTPGDNVHFYLTLHQSLRESRRVCPWIPRLRPVPGECSAGVRLPAQQHERLHGRQKGRRRGLVS